MSALCGTSAHTTGYLIYGLTIERYARYENNYLHWTSPHEPTVFPSIQSALAAIQDCGENHGPITLHRQYDYTFTSTEQKRVPLEQ